VDLVRGVEALRRALRTAPTSRLRLTLAELLDQQGDAAGAEREVERYLLQHPGDARGVQLLDRLRDR
jgi:predicted Zn-dependent protease